MRYLIIGHNLGAELARKKAEELASLTQKQREELGLLDFQEGEEIEIDVNIDEIRCYAKEQIQRIAIISDKDENFPEILTCGIREGFLENFGEAYRNSQNMGLRAVKPGDRIKIGKDVSLLVEMGENGNFALRIERDSNSK